MALTRHAAMSLADSIDPRHRAYRDLVARGCLCCTENASCCPLHKPGDNRGLAAWFKAGMPNGFPLVATCSICRADGLLYPNVDIDDPSREADVPEYKPTLVCPRCSTAVLERALVADAENFGYALNQRRVFGAAGVLAA